MFPKNDVLGELWVHATNHPLLSVMPYEEIRRKKYWICFKHFSSECIHYAGRTALSKEAVPTLFLPPRDDSNVIEKENLSIEAAPISDVVMNFERKNASELSPSLHYSRSPGAADIRKSSLKTPDDSPVRFKSYAAKKRKLFPVGENLSSILQKLKYSNLDDSTNVEVPIEVTSNIDFQALPESAEFQDSSTSLPDLPSYSTNLSPGKNQLSVAEKRELLPEVESHNSTLLKKFKYTVLDDSTNLEVSIAVPSNVDSQTLPESNECEESFATLPNSTVDSTSTVVQSSITTLDPEKAGTSKTSTPRTSIPGSSISNLNILHSNTSTCTPEKMKRVIKARIKRRRVLSTKSLDGVNMTPKGKRIISDTLTIHKELMKERRNLHRQSTRKALRNKCILLCKNFKHLSKTQQAIVQMQLRNALKDANGRRFSEEEKTLALAIYKRSPSAYRFLTQVLILPSVTTVKRNLSKIELDTGINSNISKILEECASSMTNEKDKTVILIWDETHLKNEVHYDHRKDKVIGFEDFGNRRTSKFANEILVFMVRGLWSNTKLPVSYYFSNSQTTYADLLHIVSENLETLQNAGFHVVATICDAGSSNIKLYEHLRAEYIRECRKKNIEPDPNDRVIVFNGQKICLIIDPIHMFKSERNLMLKYIVELCFKDVDKENTEGRKFAKWEHYETAFDMDINSGICDRHIPKITEMHVRKNKIKRMKVLHVCQVFSHSMGKWLQTCILMKTGITTTEGTFLLEEDAVHTAQFTLFQDNLFDSLNSRKKKQKAIEMRKPLQQILTDESPHWIFWREAIKTLENLRFRTEKKINPPRANETRDRLITHLKTMPDLWKSMKEKGFPYLKMGYVNQDPLENFFGRLKAYGVRNVSPSPFQAEGQLKALMVSDLTGKNSIGANCLDDEGTIMATLSTLSTENLNTERSGNRSHEFDQAALPVEKGNIKWSKLTTARRILSAGHFSKIVLSKIKGINECKICFEAFLSKKQNDNVDILKSAHVQCTGPVASPDYFERGYSRGVKILEKKLASIGFEANLRQSLKEELRVIDFEWIKCSVHITQIKNAFKENLVLHCINNWIVHLNQILCGKKKVIGGNLIEKEATRQYTAGLKRVNGMNKYRNPLPPELLKNVTEGKEIVENQQAEEEDEEVLEEI